MQEKPNQTEYKTEYQTKDFYGTVLLKDWASDILDRQIKRVTGVCTLVKDEDIAGFKTRGNESNWGIRVVGTRQQWTIFGCQIRAIIAHYPDEKIAADNALIVP